LLFDKNKLYLPPYPPPSPSPTYSSNTIAAIFIKLMRRKKNIICRTRQVFLKLSKAVVCPFWLPNFERFLPITRPGNGFTEERLVLKECNSTNIVSFKHIYKRNEIDVF
jgi:hypothetical protein